MNEQNRVAELEAKLELVNKTVSDLDERLEQERQLFAEVIDKKLSHLQHENTALRLRCSRQRRELSKLNRAQYMLRTIIGLCTGR